MFTPTISQTSTDCFYICADRFSPLDDGNPFDLDGILRITGLFGSRGPTTVSGFVISVVINSIKRMLRTGSFSHIHQEVLKRVFPAVAHYNPTSTVSGILGILGVVASAFGTCPRGILAGVAFSMSNYSNMVMCPFSLEAPTAFGVPVTKSRRSHVGFSPAITTAKPKNRPSLPPSLLKHEKANEPLSGKISAGGSHPIGVDTMGWISLKTSTALSVPATKGRRTNGFHVPTITTAKPSDASPSSEAILTDDCKFPKALPLEIDTVCSHVSSYTPS